jgi:hypothetical protein
MKKIFSNKLISTGLILVFILLVSAFQNGDAPCDQKTLKDKAKKTLDPYKYDLAKVTRIMYKEKPTMKEIEVPLFIGEKYRLVFNTEALPKNVIINLYNRDKESSKRKLMFSSKDAGADKKEFSFDYSFANKIFIDYDIPAGDSSATSGCVVFMLGYK